MIYRGWKETLRGKTKRISSLSDGMNNMKRVFVTISVAFVILTVIAPSQVYASPTTEDDGYTYPDDAS